MSVAEMWPLRWMCGNTKDWGSFKNRNNKEPKENEEKKVVWDSSVMRTENLRMYWCVILS